MSIFVVCTLVDTARRNLAAGADAVEIAAPFWNTLPAWVRAELVLAPQQPRVAGCRAVTAESLLRMADRHAERLAPPGPRREDD